MGSSSFKSSKKQVPIKLGDKKSLNDCIDIKLGDNNSLNDFIDIKLVLEKNWAFLGQPVKGVIIITIHETLKNCQLVFKFKGKSTGIYLPNLIEKDPNIIANIKYLLNSWEEPINPGRICFPFEFITPNNNMGSFKFERILKNYESYDNSLRLGINYYFKLVFKCDKGRYSNIRQLKLYPNKNYELPKTFFKTPKHKVGKDEGEISIKLSWINGISEGGTHIEYILEIDNRRSLVDIESIDFLHYICFLDGNRKFSIGKSNFVVSILKGTLYMMNPRKFRFTSKNTDFFSEVYSFKHKENLKSATIEFQLSIILHTNPKCENEHKLDTIYIIKPFLDNTHNSLEEELNSITNTFPTSFLNYDSHGSDSCTEYDFKFKKPFMKMGKYFED